MGKRHDRRAEDWTGQDDDGRRGGRTGGRKDGLPLTTVSSPSHLPVSLYMLFHHICSMPAKYGSGVAWTFLKRKRHVSSLLSSLIIILQACLATGFVALSCSLYLPSPLYLVHVYMYI